MSSGSFSASLSGLSATQQDLNVIGNNLANLNTTGFKAGDVEFSDLVSQSVAGANNDPMQVGLGVTVSAIAQNFSQGAIENTGSPTDVALQGNGFFVVAQDGVQSYTRAGDFSFDANGTLVTSGGQAVQGYTTTDPATGQIVTSNAPQNIVVPPGVLHAPVATTTFSTQTNLDASAANGTTFTSAVQVYDALGVAHAASMTYTKTGAGAWSYKITVPGADVSGGGASPSQIAAGTVTFDGNGKLATVNGAAAANVAITSPTWASGATPTNLTWDVLDANNQPTLTNFTSPSATSSSTQNGSAAGSVSNITIDSTGAIVASFGAGQSVTIAQLAIADFNNPQGLTKIGANNFAGSAASGLPSVGIAGTGGRGTLIGGALEDSNVDIAQQFTQMILAQRGYEANSKSISVEDELLQATLNLTR